MGLDEPFYNFRIQKTVRASKALGVYKPQELLNLSYDHTGHSELCTLFLDPAYQRNRNGLLLSKARFLFIAAFREWFSRTCLPNCAAAAMSRDSRRSGMRWAIISSTSRSPMPTG